MEMLSVTDPSQLLLHDVVAVLEEEVEQALTEEEPDVIRLRAALALRFSFRAFSLVGFVRRSASLRDCPTRSRADASSSSMYRLLF